MTQRLPELTIDGVLVSPFVAYALAALALLMVVRPILGLVGFEAAFSNPPVAVLCLYVLILSLLIVFL